MPAQRTELSGTQLLSMVSHFRSEKVFTTKPQQSATGKDYLAFSRKILVRVENQFFNASMRSKQFLAAQ
jgi:hypothetical protein